MSQRRPMIRRRRVPAEPPEPEGPGGESSLLDLPLGDDAGPDELGFGQGSDGARRPPPPPPAPRAGGGPLHPGTVDAPDSLRPGPSSAPPGGPSSPPPSPRRRGRRNAGSIWPWLLLVLLLPLAVAAGYYLRPTPPVLTLSSDLLEFGDVRVGESAPARLALRNDGESDLELLAVEIVGDPDGAFRRTEGTCGGPLVQGATCELALAFAPPGAGDARAHLRVLTNAPAAAERSVPLIGRGTAPSLEATPSSLDFGEATVGERGGRGAVRIANRGSASVEVDAVRLGGLGAADFVRRQDGCSGAELGAGEDCEVTFEFVPTTDGDRRATVEVRAGAPVASAPDLRGRGLPQLPLLAMEPARLDFARLRLGAEAEPVSVVLRNDGNGPLDIARVGISGEGDAMVSSFRVLDGGCAGSRLEPGASCRLRVGFGPKSEGQLGAVVDIEHSAAPGRHRLPVVGVGTAPRFDVQPRQLSFGEAARGRDGPWRTLEVRNTGTAELRVGKAEVRGGDRQAFEVSAAGCVRAPIPPGQSCSVEVRFRARRDGPHRAEVQIFHDAAGGSKAVPLNGLGTSGRLGVAPSSLDFGAVTVGTTRSLEVTLRNGGRAPLTVGRLRVDGAGLTLERDCSGRTLAAGSNCVASVRATPQRPAPV
ncbi:MAG: choice-of-anchor D domain-containing protein, partial [Acidobacteriota bacterium]